MMPEEKGNRSKKVVAVNVKLMPVNHSDQPISANYTNVAVAQGIAYLDCGFIEPEALALVARAAQNGQPFPKSVEGKLGVRVAMGLDVAQRLQQQLQQMLVGLRARTEAKP
jgi:hypothetical protein